MSHTSCGLLAPPPRTSPKVVRPEYHYGPVPPPMSTGAGRHLQAPRERHDTHRFNLVPCQGPFKLAPPAQTLASASTQALVGPKRLGSRESIHAGQSAPAPHSVPSRSMDRRLVCPGPRSGYPQRVPMVRVRPRTYVQALHGPLHRGGRNLFQDRRPVSLAQDDGPER